MEDFESALDVTRSGDGRAADQQLRAFEPMLLRYLRFHEHRVAGDIAGEVWLAAAGAIHQFQGDEAGFRSWLSAVARRRVIEHRRRGVRRRTGPVGPCCGRWRGGRADGPSRIAGPGHAATRHETAGCSPRCRTRGNESSTRRDPHDMSSVYDPTSEELQESERLLAELRAGLAEFTSDPTLLLLPDARAPASVDELADTVGFARLVAGESVVDVFTQPGPRPVAPTPARRRRTVSPERSTATAPPAPGALPPQHQSDQSIDTRRSSP